MIKVLIVHPNVLECEALGTPLRHRKDIGIVGYALDITEALSYLPDCDIALVSVELPKNGALDLLNTATEEGLYGVLVVGPFASEETVLKYIEAGASGYVNTTDSNDDLVANICAAYDNRALISPEMAALLISRLAQLKELGLDTNLGLPFGHDLTPREREVLELLGRRWSNRQIARKLMIEIGTVKNHVHNILNKMNVNSRKEVTNRIAYLKSTEPSYFE